MRRLAGIPGLFVEAVQALGEGIVGGLQDHGDPIDRHGEQARALFAPITPATGESAGVRVRIAADVDAGSDPQARIIADGIRKGLAYRLGVRDLHPLDSAADREWLFATAEAILRSLAAAKPAQSSVGGGLGGEAQPSPAETVPGPRRSTTAPAWAASAEQPLAEWEQDLLDEQTDPADTAKAGDDLGDDWWTARTADEEDVCDRLAEDETRFRCSRETGHRRQHVATAGPVVVWVWPNPDLLTADEQAAIAEGDPDATWLPDRGWCPPPTQPLLNGRPVSPAIVEWDRLEAVVEAARALVNWWAGHGMRRPDLDGPTAVLWDAICQLDGVQAGGS